MTNRTVLGALSALMLWTSCGQRPTPVTQPAPQDQNQPAPPKTKLDAVSDCSGATHVCSCKKP